MRIALLGRITITFLHHLTIVPSAIVGDNAGILISIAGVDPLACTPSELDASCVDEANTESVTSTVIKQSI